MVLAFSHPSLLRFQEIHTAECGADSDRGPARIVGPLDRSSPASTRLLGLPSSPGGEIGLRAWRGFDHRSLRQARDHRQFRQYLVETTRLQRQERGGSRICRKSALARSNPCPDRGQVTAPCPTMKIRSAMACSWNLPKLRRCVRLPAGREWMPPVMTRPGQSRYPARQSWADFSPFAIIASGLSPACPFILTYLAKVRACG